MKAESRRRKTKVCVLVVRLFVYCNLALKSLTLDNALRKFYYKKTGIHREGEKVYEEAETQDGINQAARADGDE